MPRNTFIPDGVVGLWFPGRGHPGQRRGTVNDLSGKNNHGTIYGSPCLYFDGVNDEAAIPNNPDFFGGHSMAMVACWFNTATTGSYRTFYGERFTATSGSRLVVYITNTGEIYIGARSASGDTYRTATAADTFADDVWHSLIAVADVNAGKGYIWVDGVVPAGWAGGVAFSGAFGQSTFSSTGGIKNQKWGIEMTTWDYKGYMQWLGLKGMDTLPTLADAQRFHDFPQAWLSQSSLDAYWHCKEDAGATVDNAEGTANYDLGLTGAVWSSAINLAHGGDARNAAGTANTGDSFTGGYRYFDGVDDCVSIPDDASLRFGTNPYQIHVWASFPAASIAGIICSKGIIGGAFAPGEWSLSIQAGGVLSYYAGHAGIHILINGSIDVTDDAVHMLSVLRYGNDVVVYVDGVADDNASAVHDLSETTKPVQLMAGNSTIPCEGNLYKVLLGTANKTIAQAVLDMKALYAQGPYK
ncbi:MAG: hypothetical protein ABIG61_17775 [Planctomycetota bacterium]